jgi:hypothetical protein
MFELILVVLGVGGIICEIYKRSTEKDLEPLDYTIGQDRIEKMERELDKLHQSAKDQLRRMK